MRHSLLPLGLAVMLVSCQRPADESVAKPPAAETAAAPAVPGSPEAKIADAMSAAPSKIASQATIMDWPATEGGAMTQLRAGTNGWVCLPSSPPAMAAGLEDPLCADGAMMSQFEARNRHEPPHLGTVGFAYMLRGDAGSSATDPFATSETADNHWVVSGPHLMIAVPDPKALEGLPTTPESGGPWVMWAGTPYAHVMAPVGPGR